MNDEQGQMIGNEIKRFAGDINLSDEQKTKLHERMAFAAGRLIEYKKSHPEVTRQDIIKALNLAEQNCARDWSASSPRNS